MFQNYFTFYPLKLSHLGRTDTDIILDIFLIFNFLLLAASSDTVDTMDIADFERSR